MQGNLLEPLHVIMPKPQHNFARWVEMEAQKS